MYASESDGSVMPAVIDATPGGTNANSYELVSEAQNYYDTRLPLSGWDTGDQTMLLIMGTRMLDALAQPFKTLIPPQNGAPAYYRIRRQWTGTRSTSTQRLAWPRTGMFDENGNLIDPTIIPQALKDALAEFAGQLGGEDRTLDNDVITQGIISLRAGSVALGFKQNLIPQVIPDAVFNIMPQSWLTDEGYQLANQAEFDVVSKGSSRQGHWDPDGRGGWW